MLRQTAEKQFLVLIPTHIPLLLCQCHCLNSLASNLAVALVRRWCSPARASGPVVGRGFRPNCPCHVCLGISHWNSVNEKRLFEAHLPSSLTDWLALGLNVGWSGLDGLFWGRSTKYVDYPAGGAYYLLT